MPHLAKIKVIGRAHLKRDLIHIVEICRSPYSVYIKMIETLKTKLGESIDAIVEVITTKNSEPQRG